MPPLLTSDVPLPVRHFSPIANRSPNIKSPHRMIPVIHVPPPPKLPKPRMYSDEPLPLKPSDAAPREATIKERIALPDRVAYTLDIGGVEMPDVGIDEVLDYVSPYNLEQFENRQFVEEEAILRIVKLEKAAEKERRKQRAKTKGQVIYQSDSDSDSQDEEDEDVETGRHGRKRPNYKHLFQVPDQLRQRRRRRKRDPSTGELMPLSDEEVAAAPSSSRAGRVLSKSTPQPATDELPKRRRRKRDKVTGELLPLSPVEQAVPYKRPRRRRHPITGELMPLGWRYDPNEGQRAGSPSSERVPTVERLSIGRDAKRIKLTSEEPSSDDKITLNHPTPKAVMKAAAIATSSESRDSSEPRPSLTASKTHRALKQHISPRKPSSSVTDSSSKPQMTLASFLNSAKANEEATSSDEESSIAEQKPVTPGKTSIMNPMAIPTATEEDEEDDDELEEGEWFVEAVLDHRLSDPRTHPGVKQTTLYKTKWEGWDEPTWEPLDSFVDLSVVEDYRRRAGLDRKSQSVTASKTSSTPVKMKEAPATVDESDDDNDDDDDEEAEDEDYEVEAILGHHMSDPRTHPGKPAVMLYKVKWIGYDEPTWEPRASFTDEKIVRQYEKRVGISRGAQNVKPKR